MDQTPALETCLRVLTEPGPAPVLLLAGEPGSGRTDFLRAVARAVHPQGTPVMLLSLDLEGYEENPPGFVGFLSLWGQRRQAESDDDLAERLERIAGLASEIPPSLAGAVLLALLLEAGAPVEDLPLGDPREAVHRLLDHLSKTVRPILHLDSGQLDAATRRWLPKEARRNPRLVLALSCAPEDADEAVAPRAEIHRLAFTPAADAEDAEDSGPLDAVRDLLNDIDLPSADRLSRFLDLAALCGRNVPSDLLMAHLEVTDEQREELLDLIDDNLVGEGDDSLLLDLQYGHPSFAGLLVYSFVSPAAHRTLVSHLPPDKRNRLAAELLAFLQQHLPVGTRGLTRLFLQVASHTGDPQSREPYRRLLEWWITPEDQAEEDLTAALRDDLDAGSVDAETVLHTVHQTTSLWPPRHRLALLAALFGRTPQPLEADLRYLRAGTLRELGQPAEALEEARRALDLAKKVHGQESAVTAAMLTLTGVLAGDLGDFDTARADFEQSLAVNRHLFGDRHPSVAASLANLAALTRHLGDLPAARDLFEQAFTIARDTQGPDHPFTQALQKARNELAGGPSRVDSPASES